MNVVEHLRELVAIDSTSSRPNAPVIELLEHKLAPHGFRIDRFRYVDSQGLEKQNLVARAGPAGDVELALVGHTDCVPFDPAWREALALTAKDGKLYARGACDTKGFIACALAAIDGLRLEAIARPLALIFTADEEIGCIGAKELAGARPFAVKRAIVGEPTQLQPIRANKGYCLGEIEFIGQEGHSAYPDKGASAIGAAGRFLGELEALDAELRARADAEFVPPYTTINVGIIRGGKAKNIIAGSCTLTLEWRPVPSQSPRFVAECVREILERIIKGDPRLRYRFDADRLDLGFATPPESELVKFMERESGKPAGTVAFGTEGPQLRELGAEVVVFGPGDIGVAHRTGEFVPEADLRACTELISRAVARFCI